MSSSPKKKERIIHHEKIQNANQIVEVLVKSYPKSNLGTQISAAKPPFRRDCALVKELEGIRKAKVRAARTTEGHECEKHASKKHIRKNSAAGNLRKKSISEKNKHRKTWEEILKDCSTYNDPSLSTTSASSKYSTRNGGLSDDDDDVHSVLYNQHMYVDRGVQTSQEIIAHHDRDNEESTGVPPIREGGSKRRKNVAVGSDVRISSVDATAGHISEVPQQNGSSRRLASDDILASPFGESAILLLRQIKEMLQRRGGSESSNVIGAVEAFICNHANGSDRLQAGCSVLPTPPNVFTSPEMLLETQSKNKDLEIKSLMTRLQDRDARISQLEAALEDQQVTIRDQTSAINELKTMSAKLLAHHERVTDQIISDSREHRETASKEGESAPALLNIGTSANQPTSHGSLDAPDGTAFEALKSEVSFLQDDRQHIMKELQKKNQLIRELKLQLKNAHRELELHYSNSLNNTAQHQSRKSAEGEDSATSEADSAYEERSSSHGTHGFSSSRSRKQSSSGGISMDPAVSSNRMGRSQEELRMASSNPGLSEEMCNPGSSHGIGCNGRSSSLKDMSRITEENSLLEQVPHGGAGGASASERNQLPVPQVVVSEEHGFYSLMAPYRASSPKPLDTLRDGPLARGEALIERVTHVSDVPHCTMNSTGIQDASVRMKAYALEEPGELSNITYDRFSQSTCMTSCAGDKSNRMEEQSTTDEEFGGLIPEKTL